MCLAFWRWLVANDMPTESFEIVQYDSCSDCMRIEKNINWINEGNGTPDSSDHFTWLYDGVEYDGEGHVDHEGWDDCTRKILVGLNGSVQLIEKFCSVALARDMWNDCFDRFQAAEILENGLSIDMFNYVETTE